MILEAIDEIIIILLTTWFVILFLNRSGIILYTQKNSRYNIVVELVSCNFCLSFWVSFIITPFAFILNGTTFYFYYIFIPVLVSPIVNKLLK